MPAVTTPTEADRESVDDALADAQRLYQRYVDLAEIVSLSDLPEQESTSEPMREMDRPLTLESIFRS